MKFSIVLASRERSQLLVKMMRTIEENTSNLKNIEVLVGIDDDDAESQDAVRHIKGWYPDWFFSFSRPRSEWLNRDYLNWVYDISGRKGEYVIVVNDDCEFRTKNWDIIIENKMQEYLKDKADGIAWGYISDGLTQPGQYCCFPLVTKKGVEALGFCMPPEFPSWSADLILKNLYSSVNRTCDLSEIMVFHNNYHNFSRPRDAVSHHVEKINRSTPHDVVPFNFYHQKLVNAIKSSK